MFRWNNLNIKYNGQNKECLNSTMFRWNMIYERGEVKSFYPIATGLFAPQEEQKQSAVQQQAA